MNGDPKDDVPFNDDGALGAAWDLLRYREGEPYQEPLDDLARRRLIDDLIDQSQDAEAEADADMGREVPRTRVPRGWKRQMVALGAIAAVTALCAGWFLSQSGGGLTGVETRTAAPESLGTGVVVLLQGTVKNDRGGLLEVKENLTPGQGVISADGSITVELPTGILVAAGPATRFHVAQLDTRGIGVWVDTGELFASVRPGRQGPPFFVETSEGRATVKGTVFSVTAGEMDELFVYRGQVVLSDPQGEQRLVAADQMATFAGGEPTAIAPQKRDEAARVTRTLDILRTHEGTAMEVNSVPSGARVTIDGVQMGTTPVTFLMRPGHRDMEVSMEGMGSVSERLEAVEGDAVSRTFFLKTAVEEGASAGGVPSGKAAQRASADDLLREAQGLRGRREWQQAADVYTRIIREFAAKPQAQTARVSLGSLLLKNLRRPAEALARYDEYLARSPGGNLAPEALWGRSQALRALGETAQEKSALMDFLRLYPSEIQAPSARLRLSQL